MPSAYGRRTSSMHSRPSTCPISAAAGSIMAHAWRFSQYSCGGRSIALKSPTGRGIARPSSGGHEMRSSEFEPSSSRLLNDIERPSRRTTVSDQSLADLTSIYPTPHDRVIAKVRPGLDVHSRRFIAMSPFCVMATSGNDGSVDASPRGGHPGFVHIDGDQRLLL